MSYVVAIVVGLLSGIAGAVLTNKTQVALAKRAETREDASAQREVLAAKRHVHAELEQLRFAVVWADERRDAAIHVLDNFPTARWEANSDRLGREPDIDWDALPFAYSAAANVRRLIVIAGDQGGFPALGMDAMIDETFARARAALDRALEVVRTGDLPPNS